MRTLANITTTELQQLASFVFPTINWSRTIDKISNFEVKCRIDIIREISHSQIEMALFACRLYNDKITVYNRLPFIITTKKQRIVLNSFSFNISTINFNQRQDIQHFIRTQLNINI